jgi:succinate dehydrogenase/fumarate reductase flavoprotein subunit
MAPANHDSGTQSFDLAVIGAGAAGLATALFAAIAGLRPLVLEHTEFVGGTSALSAGSVWIPNTEAGRAINPTDTPELAASYLRATLAEHADEAMLHRFLELGPKALSTLERHSEVHMRAFARHPDYMSEQEGATTCGRVLEPEPFNGRRLGPDLDLIRPPIPEFTLFGGMMVDRTDIHHLVRSTRSAASLLHAAGLLARYAVDRVRRRRSRRLVMGNALIGRLLASLNDRQVPIWRKAEVLSLVFDKPRVKGVTVRRAGIQVEVMVRGGVVLAGGGFNRHPDLRRALLPDVPSYTASAPGNTGQSIELALGIGARLSGEGHGHAFWAPVSVRTRKDGSQAVYPHFVLDRAKPGTLVVDQTGRRFLNESTSYNLFAKRMIEAHAVRPSIPAYLIGDRRALVAYGLGMVRPGGWGLKHFLRDGYLISAPTLAGLADALGLDRDALSESLARMNAFARTGLDEDFGRGTTVYERNLGDPAVRPNPTLGPVETAPYYAIRLYPGDIAASTGLVTDLDGRVMAEERAIDGLFAVGNDMHSVMRGAYPGPGITLGPALAFAYAAANAAARELMTSSEQSSSPPGVST